MRGFDSPAFAGTATVEPGAKLLFEAAGAGTFTSADPGRNDFSPAGGDDESADGAVFRSDFVSDTEPLRTGSREFCPAAVVEDSALADPGAPGDRSAAAESESGCVVGDACGFFRLAAVSVGRAVRDFFGLDTGDESELLSRAARASAAWPAVGGATWRAIGAPSAIGCDVGASLGAHPEAADSTARMRPALAFIAVIGR